MKLKLRVPGSSANIGPGFDSLACALTIYNTFVFEETESGLAVSGCPERYRGEDNLCCKAYRRAMAELGRPVRGLSIDIKADVPPSRGLGSSATLFTAGVMAASCMNGGALKKEDMLRLVNELEGHPDNAAAAIYGGFTVSMQENGRALAMRFPIDGKLRFLALTPDFEVSTHMARSAMPDVYTREDAVYNVSHTALLLSALSAGDDGMIRAALSDRLHQPYRKRLIRGYDTLERMALECGAIAFFISGSGSTCMALYRSEDFPAALEARLSEMQDEWRALRLSLDCDGAREV